MPDTVNTRPRKLSTIRNDVRMICHTALPASGDLRSMATFVGDTLGAQLQTSAMSVSESERLVEELQGHLRNLAETLDATAAAGQRVIDALDNVRTSYNKHLQRSGNQSGDVVLH
jgi:ABC-type transporter Mla subunit MlaD